MLKTPRTSPLQVMIPLQSDVIAICEWFSGNGLAVNHVKFLTMWLGNTMDVPTYDLGSSIIILVHSMKLLDVTIDKDLSKIRYRSCKGI